MTWHIIQPFQKKIKLAKKGPARITKLNNGLQESQNNTVPLLTTVYTKDKCLMEKVLKSV